MYKIIDRTGHQFGEEIDNLKVALAKIKRFRRSGLRVVMVDTSTSIMSKKKTKGNQEGQRTLTLQSPL